jgi:mono/diheme cytochrome c family protein
MTGRKIVSAILVILVACVVVGALLIWKPQIDPVETAKASVFNSELVAKGAELAAIGNCAVCHTTPALPRVTVYPRARENGIASK